jgi:hypothetical protein
MTGDVRNEPEHHHKDRGSTVNMSSQATVAVLVDEVGCAEVVSVVEVVEEPPLEQDAGTVKSST